jgi:antitoxin component YwqK of YwqJK toxin-antitoxin module
MTDLLNFTNSTEASETGGDYPQIDGLIKGYDFGAKSSILNITDLENDKSYRPDIRDFVLRKSARLTDFLSFNSNFFIVSKKVIDLLKNFKLPPNRQFECMIRQGDKKYRYLVLFFFRDKYDYTDYSKSKFTLRFFDKKEKLATIFNTKENFEKELTQAYQWITNVIYFDNKTKPGFDIFKVNQYQKDYFISEELRRVFINNNLTGLDYLQNVDTVFSPSHEKEIIKRNKLYNDYFLNRTSFFSNGNLCRQFNHKQQVIEEFNRSGKKERELLLRKGEFNGSERVFFANGNIKIEKLVKSKVEVVFKYYFPNGNLNYEISYHDKKGVACEKVFNIEGNELKNYRLKKGNGKILHFNSNGKGGKELVFKGHHLIGKATVQNF